jgi:hypothetical protein
MFSHLALFRNPFQMDFVTIGNPSNSALRQSMDQSGPTFDCSGVAREPTAKPFPACFSDFADSFVQSTFFT